MAINLLGLTAALVTFLSVWIGHVAIRKIEFKTVNLRRPMMIAVILGLTLEYVALFIPNHPLSAACGILGITLLWDAFEIKRQTGRVSKGHASANPDNPRHAAMLAEPDSRATTLNILKRDPVGRAVDPEEAVQLITNR